MADRSIDELRDAAATAAKQHFLASRAVVDAILRPYDLGGTQWYLLKTLVAVGELEQRAVAVLLHVERATASETVLALVRKGLAEQVRSPTDQRQKVVRLTDRGRGLWATMPDPIALTHAIAFAHTSDTEIETVVRVLQEATARLESSRTERRES